MTGRRERSIVILYLLHLFPICTITWLQLQRSSRHLICRLEASYKYNSKHFVALFQIHYQIIRHRFIFNNAFMLVSEIPDIHSGQAKNHIILQARHDTHCRHVQMVQSTAKVCKCKVRKFYDQFYGGPRLHLKILFYHYHFPNTGTGSEIIISNIISLVIINVN